METVHLETKVCKREEMRNIWICHRDQICWRKACKEMRLITVGRTFLLILLMGSVQPQRKLVLRPNSRNWSFLIINSSLPLIMILSRWTESVSLENLFLSTSVRSWFSKMKKSFCTQMCGVLSQNAPHGCLSLLTAAMEQNFFKKKNCCLCNSDVIETGCQVFWAGETASGFAREREQWDFYLQFSALTLYIYWDTS